MSSVYTQVKLADNLNRLPLGLQVKNSDKSIKLIRDIEFNRVSREDIKKIRDEIFAKNHPYMWIARILSLVVSSIGDIPVYSEYAKSGFDPTFYPEVISHLSPGDANYALYAGHIHSFGPIIKDVKFRCNNIICNPKREIVDDINLGDLMVDYSEEDYYTLTVELIDGITFESSEGKDPNLYKIINMRLPVLGDGIAEEKWYQPNNQGTFDERVYLRCIDSISTLDGKMFPKERLSNIGPSLLTKLTGRDSSILEDKINGIPTISTKKIKLCPYCSEDINFFVSTAYLFPR